MAMGVVEADELLCALWAARAPSRQQWPDCGVPWHVVAAHKVGWPPSAGSLAAVRPGELPPMVKLGGRLLAEHEHTAGRRIIPLDAPWADPVSPRTPAATHAAVTAVHTLTHVAALVDELADANPSARRQLTGEAKGLRAAAADVEARIPALAAPWVDAARAELDRAPRRHAAAGTRPYKTQPVSLR
jgi:hypothetical protein